ncbi:MAG: hypothetical protein JXR95_10390 [Deltaproteobacteria bacterium]|nr:hypothetical protein [Deltaproteobacteria bacterium]
MANLLVFIESHEGTIVGSCLHALETGRVIASKMGATLYSVLPTDEINGSNQSLLYQLSAYKTDKLIVASTDGAPPPLRINAIKDSLTSILSKFPPNIMLFGNTVSSRELAAWVTGKIRGLYVQDGVIYFRDEVELCIRDRLFGDKITYIEEDIEQPVVAVVYGDPLKIPSETSDIEVIVEKEPFEGDIINVTDSGPWIQEDTMIVLGSKEKAELEIFDNFSMENEIPVCSLFAFDKSKYENISEFFISGKFLNMSRIIFFGLDFSEMKMIMPVFTGRNRCIFHGCDVPPVMDNWGICKFTGDKSSLLDAISGEF